MTAKYKILIAARKEFLAKGYERASLRQIGRDVGYTASSIYRYWKSKNELFNAVTGKVRNTLEWAKYHPEEYAMMVERELSENNLLIKRLAKLSSFDLVGMFFILYQFIDFS